MVPWPLVCHPLTFRGGCNDGTISCFPECYFFLVQKLTPDRPQWGVLLLWGGAQCARGEFRHGPQQVTEPVSHLRFYFRPITEFGSGNWLLFSELSFLPSPPQTSLFYLSFSFSFEPMMAVSSKLPPVSVHLPGANAVMSDISLEPSTSPSSFVADDEQLTVRTTPPSPFAD